jgi:hypothetical protein
MKQIIRGNCAGSSDHIENELVELPFDDAHHRLDLPSIALSKP